MRPVPDFLLLQLPVPSVVPQEVTGNIPLAAGTLAAFARAEGRCTAAQPALLDQELLCRGGDSVLVERIAARNPFAVGFTCTVWNIERTCALAARLAQRLPDLTIILGGPEIAADAAGVSDPHAPFTAAVEGEGETVVAALCAGIAPAAIAGLLLPGGRRSGGGIVVPPPDRLAMPGEPYLRGLVRPEADRGMQLETYRGCRYRCLYCRYHQGLAGGKAAIISAPRLQPLFDWARRERIREIYLLDPSLEQRSDLEEFLRVLADVNRDPVLPMFAELRAEAAGADLVARLHRAGVRSVECGLQTLDPRALRLNRRPFDKEAFVRGVDRLRGGGVAVKVDIMIGLPGDTPESFGRTLAFVKKLGLAAATQVFRTQVLPGTDLRRKAQSLGIRYDNTPPYFVTATPSWDASSMETAFAEAERELDISLRPEDAPVLPSAAMWGEGLLQAAHETAEALWAAGVDLAHPRGIDRARTIAGLPWANAAVLWVRNLRAGRDESLLRAMIEGICTANPHTALTVVLQTPPNAPLDGIDAANRALCRTPGCRYAAQMYTGLGMVDPLRRTVALTALSDVRHENDAWREDLASAAEIVRHAPCACWDRAIETVTDVELDPGDYLFLDMGRSRMLPGDEEALERLMEAAPFPEQILLPGTALQWAWVSRRESV